MENAFAIYAGHKVTYQDDVLEYGCQYNPNCKEISIRIYEITVITLTMRLIKIKRMIQR